MVLIAAYEINKDILVFFISIFKKINTKPKLSKTINGLLYANK